MTFPGWKELLIILLVLLLIFGAKKLKTVGSDLGDAIRGFRKGIANEHKSDPQLVDDGVSTNPDAKSMRRSHSTSADGSKKIV